MRLAKKTEISVNKQRVKKGMSKQPLYKQKFYSKHSYLVKRNYITYGQRAAEILGSDAIRKQMWPWYGRLQEEINR